MPPIVLKAHKSLIHWSLKPTDFICLTLMQVISSRSRRPPPGGIKWITMKGVDYRSEWQLVATAVLR